MAHSRRQSSWSRKRKFSKVVWAFMALLGMTAAGAFVLIALKRPPMEDNVAETTRGENQRIAGPVDESAGQVAGAVPLELDEAANPLEQVIFSHYAVTRVDRVESLRLNAVLHLGEIDDEEHRHEIILYIRRPNLARRIMVHDGMRLDMGYNGSELWAQQVAPNGTTRKIENLSEHQKKQFKEAAKIGSYLWRYETEPANFTLLEDEKLESLTCHVVAYENDEVRVITYIDTHQFYEVARRETSKDDGSSVYMRMSDHREVENVVMPHSIHSMVEESRFSSVQITDLDINAGVPSYMFEEPALRYTAK